MTYPLEIPFVSEAGVVAGKRVSQRNLPGWVGFQGAIHNRL
uniref:Uncharacterized protein n=1 Tax=Klebsiella oxytoca TaxID=571 RepID=A0A1Z3MMQ2_KLEOX|nr:hypothetical protein [Klebsiella oxytoca]